MNFNVTWKPAALAELADLWTQAADRNAISAAANEIDRSLYVDAHQCGESRGDGFRILIIPPLAVEFEVVLDDRVARVLSVWQVKQV